MPLPRTRPLSRLIPLFALAAFAAALSLAPAARGEKFPEPSPYPIAPELDVKINTPKRIVVDVPGEAHPRAYWYVTYTVTNNGEKPYNFLPLFEMLSDDGRLTRADKLIPTQVFNAIKRREGNKLLESAKQIEGQIQAGEDQARDGVAIFPEPMTRMGTFHIFAGGLSEEAVRVKDKDGKPMTEKDPKTGEENPIILRKTLHLSYQVPGDDVRPGDDVLIPKGKKWVMR